MRRMNLLCLAVLASCASRPVPVSPAPPLPSLCTEDLSAWSVSRDTPFVPAEISTRAVRPAVLELQERLCDCLSTSSDRPASTRFVFVASPSEGRTEARPGFSDALSTCVGTFVATYPPFEFDGDVLYCDPGDPSHCSSQPASFVMPLEIEL